MWILSLEDSRDLTRRVIQHQWDSETFDHECLKTAFPVTLKPGEAHLFSQVHIHGNVENLTGVTRVSMDWHILIKGEEYHRRYPGAFFRMPGDYGTLNKVDTNKTYVCYLSNNSNFDQHVAKHAQRCTVEHYAQLNEIKHHGYQFENEYLNHLPVFVELLKQNVDCIIVFSMYSIPDELLEMALAQGKEIHFASEYITMKDAHDLNRVLQYKNFGVAKKGNLSFEE